MSCLNDIFCGTRTIIGIRNYAECSNPESDLFINDLPGISLKIASNVANEEIQTGNEVLKKCINTAIKKVFNDFNLQISPHFNFNAIVQTRDIDNFDEATILPATGTERGLVIKRWRSELAQIYIEQLYVKIDTTKKVDIKIYDGDTLAETIQVTLQANVINTFSVNKKFVSEKVKVLIENSGFGVYSNSVNNWNYLECGTCNGNSGEGISIKGWDGSQEDNTMYGIGVKTSVRCYEENLLCSLLPRMYYFIWQQWFGDKSQNR